MEDITEPEVKKLVMPTKSTRQEKITFRVSMPESLDIGLRCWLLVCQNFYVV